MPSLHESVDFTGKSDLPRGWEEDVYRYCTFADLDLEGPTFEGILSGCRFRDSSNRATTRRSPTRALSALTFSMQKKITHIVGSEPTRPSLARRLCVAAKAKVRGFAVFTVPNLAMSPTLGIRDVVPLDRAAYDAASISRGDVVVYRSQKHEGMLLPSRVAGLPGETIELRGSRLIVDGKEVAERYLDADAAEQPFSREHEATFVPADCVFLLGDFRDMSEDSRFIGPVQARLIVGRIVV